MASDAEREWVRSQYGTTEDVLESAKHLLGNIYASEVGVYGLVRALVFEVEQLKAKVDLVEAIGKALIDEDEK